jgi:hypothetical protein
MFVFTLQEIEQLEQIPLLRVGSALAPAAE